MIFQDALTSLNPAYTVGFQLMETLRLHLGLSKIRSAETRTRAAGTGGNSGRQVTFIRLSAPAFRWHEPARNDRHGDCLQSETADCRRTDHRARRDGTGADHGSAGLKVKKPGHGVDPDHARSGGDCRGRTPRGRDVCRRNRRNQLRCRIFSTARDYPHTQALLASIPEHSKGAERLATLPGVVPGQYDRPIGCLLSPRCPYANDKCRNEHPQLVETGTSHVRCFTPLDAAGRPIQ